MNLNELSLLFSWYLRGLTIQQMKAELRQSSKNDQAFAHQHPALLSTIRGLKGNAGHVNLKQLAKNLFDFCDTATLEEKNDLIICLGEHIKQAKSRNADVLIKNFKYLISHNQGNWKDVLLHSGQTCASITEPTLKAKGVKYKADKRAQTPVERNSERFVVKANDHSYAIIGSTFFTGREPMATNESFIKSDVTQGLKEIPNVDAAFNKILYDSQGEVRGFAFGVADGCGHPDEEDRYQTYDVTRVSYFATKHFLRLASTFTDPSALKTAIPDLLQMTAKAVAPKLSGKTNEITTLAAGIAFLLRDGSYQIVGVNIGDCSLYAYDPFPITGGLLTLAVGRQVWDGRAGGPPAFPGRYKLEEIQIFEANINENAFIIGMSDGVSDALPHDKTLINSFLESSLRAAELNLSGGENAEGIVEALTQQVVANLEKERTATIQFVQNNNAVLQEIDLALRSNDPNKEQTVFAGLSDEFKNSVAHEPDITKKLKNILSEIDAKSYINMGDDYTLMAVELADSEKRKQLRANPLNTRPINSTPSTTSDAQKTKSSGNSAPGIIHDFSIPNRFSYKIPLALGTLAMFAFAGIAIGLIIGLGFSPLGWAAGLAGVGLGLSAAAILSIDIGICIGVGVLAGAAVTAASSLAVALLNLLPQKNTYVKLNTEDEDVLGYGIGGVNYPTPTPTGDEISINMADIHTGPLSQNKNKSPPMDISTAPDVLNEWNVKYF